MKRIPLKMKRADLTALPKFALPDGFAIRFFEKGDETLWARVETSVNEFDNEGAALARFENEFGPFLDEMTHRCLFIENSAGEVIGTTTAWYGTL